MNNRPTKFADLKLYHDNKTEKLILQYRLDDGRPIETQNNMFNRLEDGTMVRNTDEKKVVVKKVTPSSDVHSPYRFAKMAHIQEGAAVPKEYNMQLKASGQENHRVVKPLMWFENDSIVGCVLVMEHDDNYKDLSDFLKSFPNGLPEAKEELIFRNILLGFQRCYDNSVTLPYLDF